MPEKSNAMNKKTSENPVILAVDTSCDDTSIAILRGRGVLSSVVSSQVELHKKWGGVMPDIARRAHRENISAVFQEALKRAHIKESEIEVVAATYGPGLAIALEVGLKFAQALAVQIGAKFIPVNHMEGHMLAPLLCNARGKGPVEPEAEQELFPAMAVLVSGNHTEIVLMTDFGEYQILCETVDDAAGEAFDKVARMLNLGYPGGPVLTLLAGRASAEWCDLDAGYKERGGKKPRNEIAGRYGLTVPVMRSEELIFSFSGLKTACLYKIEDLRTRYSNDAEWSSDFAREFINAVSRAITVKLEKTLAMFPRVKSIFVGGGVINNHYIVRDIGAVAKRHKKRYLLPDKRYRCDNAAMIGAAGFYQFKRGQWIEGDEILKTERNPRLRLGE